MVALGAGAVFNQRGTPVVKARASGGPKALKQVVPGPRVSEVDSSCRLVIVPLFRGRSRFARLVLSHHSRFNVTCECNKEEINYDDKDRHCWGTSLIRNHPP